MEAWGPWYHSPWSRRSFWATAWPVRRGSLRLSEIPWCWSNSCRRSPAWCQSVYQAGNVSNYSKVISSPKTYNGVTSGVSCLVVTRGQVTEALWGHVGSEDVPDLLLARGLLEGVGQRSYPGERASWGQVLKEHGALIGVAGNNELI